MPADIELVGTRLTANVFRTRGFPGARSRTVDNYGVTINDHDLDDNLREILERWVHPRKKI
jgi:hypothetical protein